MSDYNKDTVCSFQTQIVSYLYDEAGSEEKREFETHIRECSFCAEEIAAFGNVRFSIAKWRDFELSETTIPFVQIPQTLILPSAENKSEKSATIFEKFINFINPLNNRTALATAGFAVLLLFFGFVFLIFNFSSGEESASNTNKIEKRQALSSSEFAVDKTAAETENSVAIENSNDAASETAVENLTSRNNVKVSDAEINQTIENQSDKPKIERKKNTLIDSKPFKSKFADKRANLPAPNQSAENTDKTETKQFEKKPSLTNFSEESNDESLRLADLFDEVETK